MSISTSTAKITVALVGNPNTGKSTLFNALSGVRQRVGNYPGVTVEKKVGHLDHDGRRFDLVDLPGTYSLAPRSPDEMVTVDVLLGRRKDVAAPDVILSIVDASNLERNLYLVSQVLELGRPTVVALNMVDVARRDQIEIDVERLQSRLGVPVVPLQANRRVGLAELKRALGEAAGQEAARPESPFAETFQHEVAALETELSAAQGKPVPRYLVERLLLDSGGYIEGALLKGSDPALRDKLADARARLKEAGLPVPGVEAMARYAWVGQVLDGIVARPSERKPDVTDHIDRVLTHKFLGTAIFASMMLLVFSLIFVFAEVPMEWIEGGFAAVGEWVEGEDEATALMADGPLRSLVVDGMIAGVGGVLVFLPQILILFFFIAVLEDCGYMARAAYLMDKLMSRVGLSGKSFIPLLSSFACAVPGIMAARVIENRRDRLTTIMVAPLMSCSARLPVYGLLVAAFIPPIALFGPIGLQGVTFFCMYLVGIFTAVIVALVMKKTVLKGHTPPFVMELPSYKVPSPGTVLRRMFDSGWAFVRRAGTLILAVSILVWAATYYPRNEAWIDEQIDLQREQLAGHLSSLPAGDAGRLALEEELAELDEHENHVRAGLQQRNSILGRAGQWVEPAVRPLGWDWRIGCAAIASFPAREVVISVLGVIYNVGAEPEPDQQDQYQRSLQARLHQARWDDTGEPVYNIPVALSIMVFFALCAQCAATLAIIRRETNSWAWPVFTFVYMTTLAYLAALATYQIGMYWFT